jgi:hypothetical protein
MARWLAIHAFAAGWLVAGVAASWAADIVFSDQRKAKVAQATYLSEEEPRVLTETPMEEFPLWEDEHSGCDDGCTGCATCAPAGGYFLDSWLAQGFTGNTSSPQNRFNTPVTFNDRSNEYQMNQLYLSLGRAVNEDCCYWDIGARVDLLYGTDYFFVTSTGLETREDGTQRWNSNDGPRGGGAALYGLAMPQLYAEVFAPWGPGINVKLGHFYTPFGYERVTAPHNFFYSHAYSFQYAEPFTGTGLLASSDVTPFTTFNAGLTRGWNIWEDPNGRNSFTGGFERRRPDGRSSLAFNVYSGNEDPAGQNTRTTYTLVLTHHISQCFTYVFQHDFGTEENAKLDANFNTSDAKWYGITQYFLLGVTPNTSWGLRVEWFRDQDNARVLGIPLESEVTGGNYTEVTLGFNWMPRPYMTFRPELRWDWSDVSADSLGIQGMYNDFLDSDQVTLAADLILVF